MHLYNHDVDEVVQAIQVYSGAIVHFCPQLTRFKPNVKSIMKANEGALSNARCSDSSANSFNTITSYDCMQWVILHMQDMYDD